MKNRPSAEQKTSKDEGDVEKCGGEIFYFKLFDPTENTPKEVSAINQGQCSFPAPLDPKVWYCRVNIVSLPS